MTTRHRFLMLGAGCALALAGPLTAATPPTPTTAKVLQPKTALTRTTAIKAVAARPALRANVAGKMLRGTELLAKLNQQVTVEGFFYDGSSPMLLDDINRVQVDMMLPPDSYVPLVGPKLQGVKSGDRIALTATLRKAGASAPAWLKREPAFLEITPQVKPIVKLRASAVLKLSPVTNLVRVEPRFRIPEIVVGTVPVAKKYAVLLIGGGDPYNNHMRYWNDLKTQYQILRDKGWPAANITVIYADGVAKDGSTPVNYSATKANVSTVFSALAAKTTSLDTVYIMVNDHGGGFLDAAISGYGPGIYGGVLDTNGDEHESISEATFNKDLNGDGDKVDVVKIDEIINLWYDKITDDEFAVQVNKVHNYALMVIQMKQCFSGGFVDDLAGPRRVVMASTKPTEFSWSHSSGQFGEWTYWYFAGITGQKPDGSGAVNANANGDGLISFAELFNFCKSRDSKPEHPTYDDNGVFPGTFGPLPAGGDGALGSTKGF